jgi:dienelactone hydrolase
MAQVNLEMVCLRVSMQYSKEGTPKLLQEKTFPLKFCFGRQTLHIHRTQPQFARSFTTADMKAFYDYAKSHYRVDTTRIYITGFSLGGLMTSEFGSAYPEAWQQCFRWQEKLLPILSTRRNK